MAVTLMDVVLKMDELYNLRQFKRRLQISDVALRNLRRQGLPVIRIGKRLYLSGRQVIEFFEQLSKSEAVSHEHPG